MSILRVVRLVFVLYHVIAVLVLTPENIHEQGHVTQTMNMWKYIPDNMREQESTMQMSVVENQKFKSGQVQEPMNPWTNDNAGFTGGLKNVWWPDVSVANQVTELKASKTFTSGYNTASTAFTSSYKTVIQTSQDAYQGTLFHSYSIEPSPSRYEAVLTSKKLYEFSSELNEIRSYISKTSTSRNLEIRLTPKGDIKQTKEEDISTCDTTNQLINVSFREELGGIMDGMAVGSSTILTVVAIILNYKVSSFYRREIKKLIPFIYFSVSITDLITALSCFSHPLTLVLLLFTDQSTLSSVLILIFYCISSTSIRAGVFYNLVLSVVRSVNIVRPFYQVKLGWIKIACIVCPFLWFLVASYDVYWMVNLGYIGFPIALFKYLVYMPMVGNGVASDTLGDDVSYLETILFGMSVPFLFPAVVVTVCFVFQLYYLSSASKVAMSMRINRKAMSRRPAVTIFQLTLLFLICNLSSTAVYIYFFLPSGREQRRTGAKDARVMYLASCVLHIVNAAFSPLIMILRGRSLKRAIWSQLVSIRSLINTRSSSVGSWSAGTKPVVHRY